MGFPWKRIATGLKVALKIAVKAEEVGLIKTKGVVSKVDDVIETGKTATRN